MWPYVHEDGKRWNERKAESKIEGVYRYARTIKFDKSLYDSCCEAVASMAKDEVRDLLLRAIREMADIIDMKDKEYGFHINHITSDEKEWVVVLSKDSEEEGVDKEIDFRTFESEKQAELFAKNRDDVESIYSDYKEDYYTIVNESTGKSAFDILFPTAVRAVTFMYAYKTPEAWKAYMNYIDSKEEEDTENEE
jgi:hypothetical protein